MGLTSIFAMLDQLATAHTLVVFSKVSAWPDNMGMIA
jgi:hypothetical protein